MFKRFMIGFALGIGLMYWYIHHSGDAVSGAFQWMERSASGYRGDRAHQAVENEVGSPNP